MKQLASHVAVYTAAQFISRGAQILVLIVFPLLLSPSQYGALGIVVAASALVNVVAPLEITQGLARNFGTAAPGYRREFSASAWWFTLGTTGALAAAAWMLAPELGRLLFGNPANVDLSHGTVIFFVGNVLFYFLQNQCRWEFLIRDYVIISVGYAVLSFSTAVLLAANLHDALFGAVLGQGLGTLMVVGYGVFRLRDALFHRPVVARIATMLRFSLPLVPASLAVFVSIYASRLVVNDALSLKATGLFTFGSQIATIPSFIILGLQSATTPFVMTHFEEETTPPLLARVFEVVFLGGVLTAMGLGFFTRDVVMRFGNPAYADSAPLVLILAPAYLLQQLPVFFPGFAIARKTGLQMLVAITSAIMVVAMNYLLVGRFGLFGAASATLLSAVFFFASWCSVANRYYHIPVRWPAVAAVSLAGIVAGGVYYYLPGSGAFSVAVRIALIALVVVLAVTTHLISPALVRQAIATIRGKSEKPVDNRAGGATDQISNNVP